MLLIFDFDLLDYYNRRATIPVRSWLRGAAHRRAGEGRARDEITPTAIDRRGFEDATRPPHRNPSIFLRGFYPVWLLTWDRKPATSMALLTRGLEALGQPTAPPLSNESTWWLDQCRCWKFQLFLITLSGGTGARSTAGDYCGRARGLSKRDVLMHVGSTTW